MNTGGMARIRGYYCRCRRHRRKLRHVVRSEEGGIGIESRTSAQLFRLRPPGRQRVLIVLFVRVTVRSASCHLSRYADDSESYLLMLACTGVFLAHLFSHTGRLIPPRLATVCLATLTRMVPPLPCSLGFPVTPLVKCDFRVFDMARLCAL